MFPSKTGSLFFVRLATVFIRVERKIGTKNRHTLITAVVHLLSWSVLSCVITRVIIIIIIIMIKMPSTKVKIVVNLYRCEALSNACEYSKFTSNMRAWFRNWKRSEMYFWNVFSFGAITFLSNQSRFAPASAGWLQTSVSFIKTFVIIMAKLYSSQFETVLIGWHICLDAGDSQMAKRCEEGLGTVSKFPTLLLLYILIWN